MDFFLFTIQLVNFLRWTIHVKIIHFHFQITCENKKVENYSTDIIFESQTNEQIIKYVQITSISREMSIIISITI